MFWRQPVGRLGRRTGGRHRSATSFALPYTAREKHWQLVRRGRYAEFNLAWLRQGVEWV
ncbi:hypothetical protein Q5H93_08605 [Hymenobacter sp. ASUV-10]|uniref:Uncharacterized protein n=1 Tax=Hymenobacter aranciens TaxID=3063996 RepID=A0ABT9B9B4_9BACT|nr:hypothetical protein [Hymenobacter sp. ASUV-10]MDO7874788.1 hypothetical protein [Hymenobacter sp. ASUV-10]